MKGNIIRRLILDGYIIVPEDLIDIVRLELPKHILLTLNEDGCLLFNVSEDDIVDNRFNVYEAFESEESFRLHQVRAKNSDWGSITTDVESIYEIRYEDI